MNSIVPAANYTLDASESTITLTSPYHIVTEEQIVTITIDSAHSADISFDWQATL